MAACAPTLADGLFLRFPVPLAWLQTNHSVTLRNTRASNYEEYQNQIFHSTRHITSKRVTN